MQSPLYDKDAVSARLAMPPLCERLGIPLRQSGPRWIANCPFHAERTGSFTVSYAEGKGWRFHCFGCAAHGDVFDLWTRQRGGSFKDALRALAGLAGLGPLPEDWKPQRAAVNSGSVVERQKIIRFPNLRQLSEATCGELAELRGLDVAAVSAARDAGLIWGAEIGVSVRSGLVWGDALVKEGERGKLRVAPSRCWIVADRSGMAAQVRRFDGESWPRHGGGGFKAWTIGSARWPVGANLIAKRRCVALVEGGPDILAAYHFLVKCDGLDSVAVVGVLGASVRLHPESLRFFARKRVRIFAHVDNKDPKTGRRAGWEAAARWTKQLTEAGAEVDVWDFSNLTQQDGRPVSDLNDAARGDRACLGEMDPAMNFQPSIRYPNEN
jgi:hypothetical protein